MSTSERTGIEFPAILANDGVNGLEQFYLPVLSKAVSYLRVLPYASGTAWWILGQGFSALLQRSQPCRIRTALTVKAMPSADSLLAELASNAELDYRRRLALIGYALDLGMLEVKFVVGEAPIASRGVVDFDDGESLAFSSEHDSSRGGLVSGRRREHLLIFSGCGGETASYRAAIRNACENDWGAVDVRLKSVALPEAVRRYLLHCAREVGIDAVLDEVGDQRSVLPNQMNQVVAVPRVPGVFNGREFTIREYQRDALKAWGHQGFRGILQLATGAGKTVIAAYAATKIFEKDGRLALVVGVPYQALADQWVETLQQFGFLPIRCYESRANWHEDASVLVSAYNTGAAQLFCAVVVNRTLAGETFQALMRTMAKEHMVFVGDECHHYLGATWENLLPLSRRRLGLSATPMIADREAANERLEAYFGSICFEFSLERAIEEKVLAPYDYHLHSVDLTDDELSAYGDLAKRIADELGPNGDPDVGQSPSLLRLLMERARLFSTAANKIAKLRTLLDSQPPATHTLFYCAEGQADLGLGEDLGDVVLRHVEWVSVLLYELGWDVARFTAQEGRDERREILQRFKVGDVDGLVAIRCLDEGIDVPACSTAYFLASSRNPRQWIQRRGRVLRTAPGKTKAVIHDFVVVVPGVIRSSYKAERLMYERELARISEFAERAQNRRDVLPVVAAVGRLA